jgi:mediator of RNA polymerase II transcription subunit 8
MQREEKQMEVFLDTAISRLNDLKNTIQNMVIKLEMEGEQMNYPAFLDSFAVISGHLTSLSKLLGHEMSPPLRNLTVLPLLLSMDRDENLLQMTEGRIPQFSHDLCPNYLRTKPEPVAENRMALHEAKASALLNETAMKQVAQYTKVITHIHELVSLNNLRIFPIILLLKLVGR